MTIEAPEIIEIGGDVTIPLTVTVKRPDGTPASGYTIALHADCSTFPACTTIVMPSTGTGTETIYFHPTDYSSGNVFARATFGDLSVDSENHYIVAIPAGGLWLQPAVTEVVLAPGEHRPVAAVGYSKGGDTGAWQSATRPTYTSDNPAVATVDEYGVVTGVAAGTTTLRLALDDLTATVAITVDDSLVMGPPPEGVADLHASVTVNSEMLVMRNGADRTTHGVVVDHRGYPFAVARFGSAAVVVGWTGTGYGTEMLPDGFDYTEAAVITIDGNDRLYVVTSGQWGIAHVYDRAASAIGPATWQRRVLPYHVAELDEAGAEWTSYLRGRPNRELSLLPRFGDGFELTYRVITDLRPVEGEHDCAAIYRFASVTASTIDTSDITAELFDLPAGGGCETPDAGFQMWSLLRGTDGSTQFVLPNGNRAARSEESYWIGESLYTRDASGLWSTPPGTVNMNGGHFPVPTEGYSVTVYDRGFTDTGAPIPSVVFRGLGDANTFKPYVLSDRGRIWVGLGMLGLAAIYDANGNPILGMSSNLAAPFWDGVEGTSPKDNWSVHGVTTGSHRIHFLASADLENGALQLLSVTAPPVASPDAPEAGGRLATGTGANGKVYAPDVVLPDGKRVALVLGTDGALHVQRSNAVDAPWSQLADTATLSPSTHLVEAGGALYAFDTSYVLRRSTDAGTTFVAATGATTVELDGQLVVSADGAVLDAGGTLAYAKFNGTAGTSPFATVTLPTYAPSGGSIDTGSGRRLLVDANGFTLIAQSGNGGSIPSVYVARYSWAGAVQSSRMIGNLDGAPYETLDIANGALASDGTFVFIGTKTSSGLATLRGHRIDLSTDTWHAVSLGTTFLSMPTNVLPLGDGRLVVGTSLHEASSPFAYSMRAQLLVTTTGETWTTYTPPQIGVQELPKKLLRDGSGGLTILSFAGDVFHDSTPTTLYVQHAAAP